MRIEESTSEQRKICSKTLCSASLTPIIFFCKFMLFLGLILIIFYILEKTILSLDIDKNIIESILAFSIIFLGLGFILFFLSLQFNKLAKIAKEIENENSIEEDKKKF